MGPFTFHLYGFKRYHLHKFCLENSVQFNFGLMSLLQQREISLVISLLLLLFIFFVGCRILQKLLPDFEHDDDDDDGDP